MSLPNFLGIGAQKAGTTWLHQLLASHPDVYMPKKRKEVHYFDWHFDKGLDWYKTFFPDFKNSQNYQAIGEITPDYLYETSCPKRIAELLPEVKLIAILRSPVSRAYSQYTMQAAEFNWTAPFETMITERPDIVERGKYALQLERYLNYFPKEQLLVLIFEEAVQNPNVAKQELARFLDLDPAKFPKTAGTEKVFGGYTPKYKRLYTAAKWLSFQLHKHDIDWLVEGAKRLGARSMFGKGQKPPVMNPETKQALIQTFQADIQALEHMLETNLPTWQGS